MARCRPPAQHRGALRPWVVVGTVWFTLAIASASTSRSRSFSWRCSTNSAGPAARPRPAFSISSVVQGVLSPVVGILVDRVGPRRIMLGGAGLLGVACVLASRIGSLWSLYMVVGVLAATGLCAVSWVPSGTLIARVVHRAARQHAGAGLLGHGRRVLVMGPLAQWLITGYGWRAPTSSWAWARSSCWCRSSGWRARGPSRRRRREARSWGRARARRRGARGRRRPCGPRAFWALFFAYLCTPLAVFSTSRIRWPSPWTMAFRACSWRASSAHRPALGGGRILFGIAADRIGRTASATVLLRMHGGGDALPARNRNLAPRGGTHAYALFFGLGFGARGPIITAIASQLSRGGASASFLRHPQRGQRHRAAAWRRGSAVSCTT